MDTEICLSCLKELNIVLDEKDPLKTDDILYNRKIAFCANCNLCIYYRNSFYCLFYNKYSCSDLGKVHYEGNNLNIDIIPMESPVLLLNETTDYKKAFKIIKNLEFA